MSMARQHKRRPRANAHQSSAECALHTEPTPIRPAATGTAPLPSHHILPASYSIARAIDALSGSRPQELDPQLHTPCPPVPWPDGVHMYMHSRMCMCTYMSYVQYTSARAQSRQRIPLSRPESHLWALVDSLGWVDSAADGASHMLCVARNRCPREGHLPAINAEGRSDAMPSLPPRHGAVNRSEEAPRGVWFVKAYGSPTRLNTSGSASLAAAAQCTATRSSPAPADCGSVAHACPSGSA